MKSSIVLTALVLISTTGAAQEIYPFFRGIRAQGMGGASVATVNDETALFLNPAGLGKLRGAYFIPATLQMDSNYDTNTALSSNYNFSALKDPAGLLTIAQANPNKHLHAVIQTLPAIVTTNLGIGVYGKYSVDAQYNPATNDYRYDYTNDVGGVVGYCLRLWEGRIKIGVAGKIINRVYVGQDFTPPVANFALSNIAAEGTGAGVDAGLILTAPWIFLPTLAAAAHDVGTTKFNMATGYFYKTGVYPPPQPQSIDVGFGLFPINGKFTRTSITGEYRDVQNPEQKDIYRRIHAGIEINFNDVLYLRGGMNQRYYTAGMEFDLGGQQFQFATYGEEIGTPTLYQEDRRFMVQYGWRF